MHRRGGIHAEEAGDDRKMGDRNIRGKPELVSHFSVTHISVEQSPSPSVYSVYSVVKKPVFSSRLRAFA